MLTTRAPLRVSLFGGGTDYPEYLAHNRGSVLGGTIDKHVYIQSLPLHAAAEQKIRFNYRITESVQSVDDLQHPVLREAIKYLEYEEPLNIGTMSDLPGGTGLGSSSSFTVGILYHLLTRMGRDISLHDLVKRAIHLERNILSEPVGVQDQHHAVFGGFCRYEWFNGSVSIQPVNLSESRLKLLNESVILVYTGTTRSASTVLVDQQAKNKSGINNKYLDSMHTMTKKGLHIIEDEVDDNVALQKLSQLLNESWALKKNLSKRIASNEAEIIIKQLENIGVKGYKLLGAGNNGFVLAMASPSKINAVEDHFGVENCVRFKFVNHGVSSSTF